MALAAVVDQEQTSSGCKPRMNRTDFCMITTHVCHDHPLPVEERFAVLTPPGKLEVVSNYGRATPMKAWGGSMERC